MQCALCKKENNSKELSHIIPKFIFKKMVKTSKTGFLREVNSINQRVQDGIKCEFLCDKCEDLLNNVETIFATKIFNEMYNKNNEFQYDSNDDSTLKFCVSLVWRVLKYMYVNNQIHNIDSDEINILNDTLDIWGNYLLGNSDDIHNKNIYLIPIKHSQFDKEYIKSIGMYFDIFDEVGWGMVYVKIPNMIIIGDVIPSSKVNLNKYKITSKQCTIKEYEQLDLPHTLNNLIYELIQIAHKNSKQLSEKQLQKIKKSIWG